MKIMFRGGMFFLLVLSALFTLSCGGSGSGGGEGDQFIKYSVQLNGPGGDCQIRIEFADMDGNERIVYQPGSAVWNYTFYAGDGARLYLNSQSNDCGSQATASLFLNSERVKFITRFNATIEGYLRVDAEGNAVFEDLSPE